MNHESQLFVFSKIKFAFWHPDNPCQDVTLPMAPRPAPWGNGSSGESEIYLFAKAPRRECWKFPGWFQFSLIKCPHKEKKNKTAGICFRAFSFCETGQQKTSFQVSLHVSFFGCVSVSWQAGSTFESWWLKASTELVYSALTNTMTVSSLQFWYKMHITFTNSNEVQDHSIQTSKNKRNLSTSDLEGCGG